MKRAIYIVIILGVVLGGASFAFASENKAPVWGGSSNYIIPRNQQINIRVNAYDPNGDFITYGAVKIPGGAIFDQNDHTLKWRPNSSQLGKFIIILNAHDGVNAPVQTIFYITVIDANNQTTVANRAPVFESGARTRYTIEANQLLKFSVLANDPENDTIYYTASALPLGAKFDPFMHEFSWLPVKQQLGFHSMSFRAVDRFGHTATLGVTVLVKLPDASNINPFSDPNASPYFTTKAVNLASANEIYSYQPKVIDPEGDVLTYGLVSGPSGSFVNQVTGMFTWLPTKEQSGQNHQISISVKDYSNEPVIQKFIVTVSGSTAPVKVVVASRVETPEPVKAEPKSNVALASDIPDHQEVVVMEVPSPMIDSVLSTMNISITSNEDGDIIVSWNNNIPATAEVLFGLSSEEDVQEYDFTTGEFTEPSESHKFNLGQLDQDQTYYLRIVSKNGDIVNVSPELIFTPQQTQIEVDNEPKGGVASIFEIADKIVVTPAVVAVLILIILILLWMLAGKRL